ncbi:MAG: hypothetical protein KZQ91_19865 [Candidatus Thiodiazotropha sp. (ex Lucinoma borealis)]|nr:hypothetical protein [Candidatus Thiodiazotropha sp. (ex Lucinoma borealis)]
MNEYPKLNIALEYLEAAIEEREVHQRYFAAMNLAGVAEELLGKIIRSGGGRDQLTRTVDDLELIQERISEHLEWEQQLRKQGLKKLLGSTKNSIKHMDSASDSNAKLYFDVEDESKWLIQAAIRNLDILDIYHSGTVKSFVENYAEADSQP